MDKKDKRAEMVSEVRSCETMFLSKEEMLSKIDRSDAVISSHEHHGAIELFCPELGTSVYYAQDFDEHVKDLTEAGLLSREQGNGIYAAAFFTFPIYERFRAISLSSDGREEMDIYRNENNCLLEATGKAQAAFNRKKSSGFLPLPFLLVDPNLKAYAFEKQYKTVLPFVAGLKWHPFAQCKEPKDYVDSGYIDLAADYRFPTVIHSDSEGEPGDICAIFNSAGKAAEKRQVSIDIAHMGYFHNSLRVIEDFEFCFLDLCPVNALLADKSQPTSREEKTYFLAGLLSSYGNRVLWGLDSPFNWSVWPDGRKTGASFHEDANLVRDAIRLSGVQDKNAVFNTNPRRFLKTEGVNPEP